MKSIIRKWHLEGLDFISRGRKAPPRRLRKIFEPPWHIHKSVFPDFTVGCIQIPVLGIKGPAGRIYEISTVRGYVHLKKQICVENFWK